MNLKFNKQHYFLIIFLISFIAKSQQVGVNFTRGLFGEIGNNVNSLSSGGIQTSRIFSDLEINAVSFYQTSYGTADSPFTPQGNDVPGRLRIYKTDNSIIDLEAIITWSDNSPQGFGIIFPETISSDKEQVAIITSSNGNHIIYNGEVKDQSTNLFLWTDPSEFDNANTANGATTSGNASNPIGDLNTYYKAAINSDVISPTVTNQSYSYFENRVEGETIASVVATDNIGIVSYSILNGDTPNFFTINNQGIYP